MDTTRIAMEYPSFSKIHDEEKAELSPRTSNVRRDSRCRAAGRDVWIVIDDELGHWPGKDLAVHSIAATFCGFRLHTAVVDTAEPM
jgi:hypothetical protein